MDGVREIAKTICNALAADGLRLVGLAEELESNRIYVMVDVSRYSSPLQGCYAFHVYEDHVDIRARGKYLTFGWENGDVVSVVPFVKAVLEAEGRRMAQDGVVAEFAPTKNPSYNWDRS